MNNKNEIENVQPRNNRPPLQRLEKAWQRMLILFVLGTTMAIFIWFGLQEFDPSSRRNTRYIIAKLMLSITSPINWFWIIFIISGIIIPISNEYNRQKRWPKK